MRRGAKPAKAKVKARRPAVRKSAKNEDARVRELEKRLAESLEQQTATAEILRVIGTSPMDTQPVFDAIVESAARLCDARFTALYRYDGDLVHVAAHHNLTPEVLAVLQRLYPMRPAHDQASGRAIMGAAVVHLPNVLADPEYRHEVAIAGGWASLLAVPMMREGRAVGTINIYRGQAEPFPENQIELLKTFADQAVIAIENVRLFTELRASNRHLTEALDQQTATAEILKVISGTPTDAQPVFDTIVRNAGRVCDAVDAVLSLRKDNELTIGAHWGPIGVQLGRRAPLTEGSVMGRTILGARPIHIADLQTASEFPAGRELAIRWGHRTTLGVPLLREGDALGALLIRRREVRPFSDAQIAMLQTFADQAVIAIENVRLFTELEGRNHDLTESLEQQTATADVLRVIASSPTDLQAVLNTVAERATRLCGANDALIFQADGEFLRPAVRWGSVPTVIDADTRIPISRASVTGRAQVDGEVVHIHDIATRFEEFSVSQRYMSQTGVRTVLVAPLLREGAGIGVILIRRLEIRPFTDKQIDLLKTFADQAVIAIENVRLFTELEGRNRDLTATAEILRVISSSQTDVQPVFDTIVRSAVTLCNGLFSALFQFDGELIHQVAHHNFTPEALEAQQRVFPTRPSRGLGAGRAILDRAVVHIPDFELDQEHQHKEVSRAIGCRSGLFVPMLREGAPIGAIMVARAAAGPFSDSEIELLKTFADQAVIAVENVRLFTELQASNRELTTALDKQTATSDILRVISRSQTDVQPVFDAIVASAVRLLGGYSGGLTRVVGDQRELAAFMSTDTAAAATLSATYPRPVHSQGAHGQAIRDRAPVNILDMHTDLRVTEAGRTAARIAGYRSVVTVPLLRHDEAIGALGVTRREPGGFTDDEIALLKTFADQAVIAIENVRLFNELEGRNRDLTATSEILRVISQSPTDVQPVFDTIVRSAVRLCDGLFSALFQFDGEMIHFVAQNNFTPEALAEIHRIFPTRPTRALLPGRAILERAVVHIPDVLELDPEFRVQAVARTLGFRSGLWVPMLREGAPIGVIVVARAQPGPFSDSEIELLKTFADQAVIAIENVRLFKELQARTGELTQSVEKLTALGEVSRAVTSTLDVETVLNTIVSRASQLAGAAGCSIFEYDAATQQFELRATHNDDAEFVAALRAVPLRKGEGLMGRAAEMREPIQIPDITQPGAYESSVRDTLVRFGYRALLSVPLLREDQIIGSLSFTRKAPGEFPPEVVDVLKTFATQSALAIQNARLFREIADKSAQLEAASRHKSEFLANMSHELRTPLNAIIGFSEILAEKMFGDINEKQTEYLHDILESGRHLLSLINDILDLSKVEAGRMELELSEFDLPSAIDNALILVRERASRRGITLGSTIEPRLGMIGGDERKVKQVLLNLLSNALKFTPEGGRIDVGARQHGDKAEVSVADTGVGIAPADQEAVFEEFRQVGAADKKSEGTGLGLALARKFIELHGGRIWVKSQVGAGSTFTFTLPLQRSSAA